MLICYYVFKRYYVFKHYSVFSAKLQKEKNACKLSRHNFPSQREKESNRFRLLFKKVTNTYVKSLRYGMQAP